MAEIVQATDDDVARCFRGVLFTSRWFGKAIRKGKLVAGIGGVIDLGDGLWFAFLDVPAYLRSPAMYRHILNGMDEAIKLGATRIRALCDTDVPRAEALMTRLGFEPTEEETDGKVVWEWRHSQR